MVQPKGIFRRTSSATQTLVVIRRVATSHVVLSMKSPVRNRVAVRSRMLPEDHHGHRRRRTSENGNAAGAARRDGEEGSVRAGVIRGAGDDPVTARLLCSF